ncbi:MAG: YebC/PmpR family DNA-binding transcriptional regulator [Candidatus Electryonea clarkiae]|nr:YebC/PmpR family DNA-binding transcriptional regulator [Candidatus Electryonea clarkiae]
MSGHSKWATIRRKKEKTDAARGRIFSRLIKEISVAARMGGGDVDGNPRLRSAVAVAKAANMPQDNMVRAIKKGTGELPGAIYEEITYEGYGPGGCAIMIDTMTDNKNRTFGEIRHMFSKHGGNLADTNAVAYLFDRKTLIEVESMDKTEDEIFEAALEFDAEDITDEGDTYSIVGEPNDLESLKSAMESIEVKIISAEVTMIPKVNVEIDEKHAKNLLRLMELIEENDDVQKVYSNFDIAPEILEKIE